jgi:hypothetical protein
MTTPAPDSASCAASWASYSKYLSLLYLKTPKGWDTSYTLRTYETLRPVGDGFVYTACDGIPRFRFSSTPTATITTTFFVNNTQYSAREETTQSFPNCEPDRGLCDKLWQKYNSNSSAGLDDAENLEPNMPVADIFLLLGNCGTSYCGLEAGEEVVLIYWPPAVTSRDICAADGHGAAVTLSLPVVTTPVVITTSAITFRGQDLYSIDTSEPSRTRVAPSILTGPFTFTSPTVYMAHHPISRNMPPHQIVRPAGVAPLKAEDIYTTMGSFKTATSDVVSYANQVAQGRFENAVGLESWSGGSNNNRNKTADQVPFDFGHLQNPVPAHLYYDDQEEICHGRQTHGLCATITDDTYRPRIGLKNKVWLSLLANSSGCWRPQLRDPPIALVPIPTIASPSLSSFNHIDQAEKGETLALPVPGPTIGAQPTGSLKKSSAQSSLPPLCEFILVGFLVLVFWV